MGAIGVSAGSRTDCADSLSKGLLTWLQLADSAGLATGVVSTARLTHATRPRPTRTRPSATGKTIPT